MYYLIVFFQYLSPVDLIHPKGLSMHDVYKE